MSPIYYLKQKYINKCIQNNLILNKKQFPIEFEFQDVAVES